MRFSIVGLSSFGLIFMIDSSHVVIWSNPAMDGTTQSGPTGKATTLMNSTNGVVGSLRTTWKKRNQRKPTLAKKGGITNAVPMARAGGRGTASTRSEVLSSTLLLCLLDWAQNVGSIIETVPMLQVLLKQLLMYRMHNTKGHTPSAVPVIGLFVFCLHKR